MSEDVLLYTTLGELVQKYRKRANLTISEVARLSGVSKGVISKIENGETKRPELKTIRPIAQALDIPFIQIIEHYIDVDQRPEVLRELLMEAIQLSHLPLVSKVALRFLQSPYEDSHSSLERLHEIAASVHDTTFKLSLYEVMIQYARTRGIQRFLAKALLQKYLIERDDLTRLEETYHSGKYMLHYHDFLSPEERILMYYKLGVHAYNLRVYEECIDFCQQVVLEDQTNSRIKADATLAICNSYYYLGDYQLTEYYLKEYGKYTFPGVEDNVKIVKAVLDGKKGNVKPAIAQLKEFLMTAGDNAILHAVNQLFELYKQTNDLAGMNELLQFEHRLNNIAMVTPYKKAQYAYYYKLKGDFLVRKERFEDAIDCYLTSVLEYAKVSAHDQSYECVEIILSLCSDKLKDNNSHILKKLQNIYNKLRKN